MSVVYRVFLTLLSTVAIFSSPSPAGEVIHLDQGWSKDLREKMYRIPQGSFLMPYSWFMALEQPYSENLFRDDRHIESLRFIPEGKNQHNPDALPIGFAKGLAKNGEAWIGLTCAACHTTQLTYSGKTLRVDGGSTLADLMGFQSKLVSSLKATVAQPAKFERFTTRVLGDKLSSEQVAEFSARVRQQLTAMADWEARNRTATPVGFGHFDAVNVLLNAAAATAQNEPANYRVPQAGVSTPSLWLTPEYDAMLYHAAIQNQLARGLGEVIVVFGDLKVTKKTDGKLKYDCSAELKLLDELYRNNYLLKPPVWPEEVLGKLDAAKVKRGEEVYIREGCATCHANKAPYPRTTPNAAGDTFIKINRVPLKEIGTDPGYAEYFIARTAKPGILAPAFAGTPLANKETISAAFMFVAMLRNTMDAMMEQTVGDPKLRARMMGTQPLPELPRNEKEMALMLEMLNCYRAAPLAGVWSTPPYLHNASVPTLYDLLLPPEKRAKTFYLGKPEYDPVKVGYQTAPFEGGYRYDTTLPGYSNRGHLYGTTISEEDRMALLEYLKTL
jgi:hypothetical protein